MTRRTLHIDIERDVDPDGQPALTIVWGYAGPRAQLSLAQAMALFLLLAEELWTAKALATLMAVDDGPKENGA